MRPRRKPVAERPLGVLYVANSDLIGSANRFLMSLITGLDRARFRPFVLSPGDGPLLEWTKAVGVPTWVVREADWLGHRALIRRAVRLVTILLRERIGIVHAMAPMSYRAAGLAGLLTGTSRICHLQFPAARDELQWGLRFAPEAVVTCYGQQATEARAALQSSDPRCRVIAIPNGIDPAAFAPAASGSCDGRETQFGASRIVLTVARLSEVKGYPVLLDAAAAVVSQLNDCAFVILGDDGTDPSYRSYLEDRILQLGLGEHVHILGWREQVADLLRLADVMVLASLDEGLPLAVLEAMGCGLPVVATRVGGIPEAVIHGTTGLLVPPGDSLTLAAAILQILNQPTLARQMRRAGRLRVEAHFSLNRVVAAAQGLYDKLCPPSKTDHRLALSN